MLQSCENVHCLATYCLGTRALFWYDHGETLPDAQLLVSKAALLTAPGAHKQSQTFFCR